MATTKTARGAKKTASKRSARKASAKRVARKSTATAKKTTARKTGSSDGARQQRFDIVLVGATGFTGGLTAEYLAEVMPEGARWAIAGRNPKKLEDLRDHLSRLNPAAEAVALLAVDTDDAASCASLAARTRVLASTVGPYVLHGEALVAACARSGTHYLDITGEPEFVDRMWLRHHEAARASGARLVHCCGFDSIPHDLGALFTAQQLPEGAPKTIRGYVRAGGRFSAGTYHSALLAFSRMRGMAAAAGERRRRERFSGARGARALIGRPHFDRRLETWVVPFPSVDPQIVLRSARTLPVYGPKFRYGHFIQVPKLVHVGLLLGGVGTLAAAAQVPPLRNWLMRRKTSGEGPDAATRDRGWFRVRFFGEGGGRSVVADVTGGDPGYGETARMLGEAILCMAFDKLPDTAGQLTPAVAMGDALIRRLQAIGIRFSVVEAR